MTLEGFGSARADLAWVLCVAALAGCARAGAPATPAPPAGLSAAVDAVIGTEPLDQVQWGVLAVERASGRLLYQRSPTTKFIPASNMKVPVAAAAFHWLGPGYRFETAVHAAGTWQPAAGVLDGDLVLPGTGDPTLSGRFWADDVAPLHALVDSLRNAGLRAVSGSLVVDASGWDSVTAAASWMVEDLPRHATGGAFVLAEGLTTVLVQGAAVAGQPPSVSWFPRGEDGFVASRLETTAPDGPTRITAAYHPESRRLVLDGWIAAGRVDTLRLGTRDPVRQAAAALSRAMAEGGIDVKGGWRVAWDPGERLAGGCVTGGIDACEAPLLARLASPLLAEVAEAILTPSHNWITEQVVRALGPAAAAAPPVGGHPAVAADASGHPPVRASWPTGLAAVSRYMVEVAGVDSLDFQFRDGSGLSTQNLLTARALVRLFEHAERMPWGPEFRAALPEPGRPGGTLAARLLELEGRVSAKTGTLTNVASLSGHLTRSDGTAVLFSILTNGSGLPAARVREAIDEVVRVLAGG